MSGSRETSINRDSPKETPKTDWRPVALAVVAWFAAWLCTSRSGLAIGICVAAGLATAGFGARRKAWFALAGGLVAIVFLPCAALRVWVSDDSPLRAWADEGVMVTMEARVGAGRSGQGQFSGEWWSVPATVSTVTGRGQTWATRVPVQVIASGESVSSWRAVAPGTMVRASVRLAPADDGTASQAIARAREPPLVLANPSAMDQVVEKLHQGLRDSVAGLADGPRQLVPALVVGDTSTMDDGLRKDFVTTGLTHLTAVSGANLTILLGCAMAVAVRVGARGWWLRGIAAVVVVFFVVLCRGEPSVLRAAAMGAVGLSALGWGGLAQGMRFLSWAVIGLLLVDPWLCRSVGFALSAAATAGIVCWARPWSQALAARIPGWLADALCVPLAAQLATQPIVTAISGQVSMVGLLANAVAGPLVAPATVLGFVATGLSVVSLPLASVPGTMAGWFAQGLCWVAEFCAGFPGAAFAWSVEPAGLVLVGLICLGLVLVLPAVWARRWVALALGLAAVVVVVRPVGQPGWPPGSWQVVSCDVGQGDATVLNAGPGQAVVVDTGPDPAPLDACLSNLGVTTVLVAVLTHLHADHIGGVTALRQGRDLQRLITSGVTSPESGWAEVRRATDGVPADVVAPGATIQAGAVSIQVLSAKPLQASGDASEGESADENDSSLVMRAQVGPLTILLGGDVEESGQRAALQAGQELSADVVLVPHHGSAHQDPGYLRASGAGVALVSVGRGNSYGHPAPTLLHMLADDAMTIFRTDLNGSIAVTDDAGALTVTVQREPP